MKKILITLPLSEQRMTRINEKIPADCLQDKDRLEEELHDRIGAYEGILLMGPVKELGQTLMDRAKKLEIVSNFGVGYDKIDVDYAKKRGIVVANTPHAVTIPTAELAVSLMCSLCRRVTSSDRAVRRQATDAWFNTNLLSISLQGKKLGIIGLGRIGQAVAQRARAFDMTIQYYQRTPHPASVEAAYDAHYLPLEDLLSTSDIVSLHVPLTEGTEQLLNADRLQMMKPTAFLINTARGPVVDQTALMDLLQQQKIAGAALDVFDGEPTIPDALRKMEQVILTPHIGTAPKETRAAMLEEALGNLIDYFADKPVKNRVA